MAAKAEQVIIELIIKSSDTAKAISGLASFDKKVAATQQWLKSLAATSGQSVSAVASAMKKMNDALASSGEGSLVEPGILRTASTKEKDAAAVASAKRRQAAETAAHKKKLEEIAVEKARISAAIAEERLKRAQLATERSKNSGTHQAEAKAEHDKIMSYLNMEQQKSRIATTRKMIPADQSQSLATMAMEFEQLTKVPAAKWLQTFNRELGFSQEVTRNASRDIHNLRNGIGGMAKEAFNLGNFINTAFGTFTAMVLFQIVQQLMNVVMWFGTATKKANEFSQAVLKLQAGESIMSNFGVDITPQDLQDMVARLNEKFVLVPRIDIQKAVTKATLDLAELGYNKAQLEEFLNAAMVFQIANPEKTVEQIIESMAGALSGGSMETMRQYQVILNETTVSAKAVAMGLWDGVGALDPAVKRAAVYALIMEKAASMQGTLLKTQNSSVYAQDRFNAAWSDFTEDFGQTFAPMWNAFVGSSADTLSMLAEALGRIQSKLEAIYPLMAATVEFAVKLPGFISAALNNFDPKVGLSNTLSEMFSGLIEKYKEDLDSIKNLSDTPTGEAPLSPNADDFSDATDSIKSDIQSLLEWLDDLGDKARKMQEDFSLAMKRMVFDFNNVEVPRFMEDWALDRQQLIEDAQQEEEASTQDFYDREAFEYMKFQEEMRQLREKYLFDLDDALAERDARQVLRLSKQYGMDVTAATNEYNIAAAQRAAQQAQEAADRRRRLQDRIAALDAERELELKRMKEDFALKQAREKEDHKIDMERLAEEIDEKLMQVAEAMAEELKLDADGAKNIYNALNRYYGSGGAINSLFNYTYQNLVSTSAATYKTIMEYVAKYKAAAATMAEAQQQIYGGSSAYGGIYMPQPGLYNKGVPKTSTTPNTIVGNPPSSESRSVIDINLEDGLVGKIVDKSVGEVSGAMIRFNKGRRV